MHFKRKSKVKTQVINFNHISPKLTEEEEETLKKLYAHYHFKAWAYKKAYRKFKKINTALSLASISLNAVGVVIGSITLNVIILGSVSGLGVLLQAYLGLKDFKKKIEMTQFAHTNYSKILNKIRQHLRGEPYDNDAFIQELYLLDNQVTDLCPLIDKYRVRYVKTFDTT